MILLTRRQVFKTGALIGVASLGSAGCQTAPAAPAVGAAAPAVGAAGAAVRAAASHVVNWLADVSSAVTANLITERAPKTATSPQWTSDGQPWSQRYDQALSESELRYWYHDVYAIGSRRSEGIAYPGGCVGAGGYDTNEEFRDAALFVTRKDQVLVDWWARQGISALMAQTYRDGIDETARLRERKLLLLTVLPVHKAARGSTPDGRARWLHYRAADGNEVKFTYSMAANGDEKVTVDAPGFPRAGGPALWDVPLTRILSAA